MAFEYFYLTAAGTRYAAKTAAGAKLQLTKGQFGDGVLNGGGMTERTMLVNPLGEMEISKVRTEGATAIATTQFSNRSGNTVLDPFYLTEIGLFGKIEGDDTCPETLIAYANTGSVEKADYIPAMLTEFIINWPCVVSNAENVTVVIDESLVYPTKQELGQMLSNYIPTSQKGIAEGVATLGVDGKILAEQIPITEITVDDALSAESENPVQNKVITQAIGDIGTILDDINGEVI